MFKKNENEKDNMNPGPTPERVLAVCRLVDQGLGSYTSQDLDRLCGLDEDAKTNDVRSSTKAAEELGFIEKSDDKKYKLKTDQKNIESANAFRKAVSYVAFRDKDSKFFKLTSWFISHSDEIFHINRFSDFAATVSKSESELQSLTENDVLGWRFWMRFLGIAYQYKGTLIPNMKIRLEDTFELSNVSKDTRMNCIQFVSWLKENLPEAAEACTERQLPLAISNGLRILNSEKKIELISTRDAVRTSLSHMEGTEINDFSEIIIRGCAA